MKIIILMATLFLLSGCTMPVKKDIVHAPATRDIVDTPAKKGIFGTSVIEGNACNDKSFNKNDLRQCEQAYLESMEAKRRMEEKYNQCQQKLTNPVKDKPDLTQTPVDDKPDEQRCQKSIGLAPPNHNTIKQDCRDARHDYQQCKLQVTLVKAKLQSCQRSLELYKDNEQSFKKLPDKGFE